MYLRQYDPVVILGGSFATPRDYWEMRPALEKLTRQPVSIVPVTRLDWALGLTGFGWARILKKLDRTVRRTLAETGAAKVVLVGHSSGGVIGRLYLSPRPFRGRVYAGRDVVCRLITLGSPHLNRRGSAGAGTGTPAPSGDGGMRPGRAWRTRKGRTDSLTFIDAWRLSFISSFRAFWLRRPGPSSRSRARGKPWCRGESGSS